MHTAVNDCIAPTSTELAPLMFRLIYLQVRHFLAAGG